MKRLLPIYFIALFLLAACNQKEATKKSDADIEIQIQDLKDKYRPGFGEYMIGIQLHHSKLWFAGINNNWKLADYEIGEIKESFQSIKEVETDRPEVKDVGMIAPALDSLSSAITNKDEKSFRKNFEILTATCNNCHTNNKFEFNVIVTPTAPPVTNQDFTVHQQAPVQATKQ